MLEMIDSIVNMLISMQEVLKEGIVTLNEASFDNSFAAQYLGYMRYAMGTPLYFLFSSIALVAVTITIYSVFVKGISYLRSCL